MIIPAIVPYNLDELERKVAVAETFSPWVHLDVADGHFAPEITWQEPDDLETIEGKIKIQVHLMTEEPQQTIALWKKVADRIIIHAEAVANDLEEVVESFNGHPAMLGLALKLETPVEVLSPYLSRLKFVHLMSIATIGHQGETFNEMVLSKIKALHEQKPDLVISVDGGLNKETIPLASAAGASEFIVGSAIWSNPDPAQAFHNLNS